MNKEDCLAMLLNKGYRATLESGVIILSLTNEKAVKKALENPRPIDMNLVDAQQARRILDRLVGYSISPAASSRLNDNLSAGRVQSVALKMVVDREREIKAFVPKEYWNMPQPPRCVASVARRDSPPKPTPRGSAKTGRRPLPVPH